MAGYCVKTQLGWEYDWKGGKTVNIRKPSGELYTTIRNYDGSPNSPICYEHLDNVFASDFCLPDDMVGGRYGLLTALLDEDAGGLVCSGKELGVRKGSDLYPIDLKKGVVLKTFSALVKAHADHAEIIAAPSIIGYRSMAGKLRDGIRVFRHGSEMQWDVSVLLSPNGGDGVVIDCRTDLKNCYGFVEPVDDTVPEGWTSVFDKFDMADHKFDDILSAINQTADNRWSYVQNGQSREMIIPDESATLLKVML